MGKIGRKREEIDINLKFESYFWTFLVNISRKFAMRLRHVSLSLSSFRNSLKKKKNRLRRRLRLTEWELSDFNSKLRN